MIVQYKTNGYDKINKLDLIENLSTILGNTIIYIIFIDVKMVIDNKDISLVLIVENCVYEDIIKYVDSLLLKHNIYSKVVLTINTIEKALLVEAVVWD